MASHRFKSAHRWFPWVLAPPSQWAWGVALLGVDSWLLARLPGSLLPWWQSTVGPLPSSQVLGSTSSAKHPRNMPVLSLSTRSVQPGTPAGQGWCWPRAVWGSDQASQLYSLFQGGLASSWLRVEAPQARTLSHSFYSLGWPSAWPWGLVGGLGSLCGWTHIHSLLWSVLSDPRGQLEGEQTQKEDGIRKPFR